MQKLYLERWLLETAFKTLTVHLRCEPNTLGYPPAALFAFCVAIACYNLVGAMLGAVRAVHGEEEEKKVSSHEVADELAGTYRGMSIAVPDADWEVFRAADAVTLARLLKEIVTPMRVEHYHKYPSRSKKGPKTHRESARGSTSRPTASCILICTRAKWTPDHIQKSGCVSREEPATYLEVACLSRLTQPWHQAGPRNVIGTMGGT